MRYAPGGMGVHFLNYGFVGPTWLWKHNPEGVYSPTRFAELLAKLKQ